LSEFQQKWWLLKSPPTINFFNSFNLFFKVTKAFLILELFIFTEWGGMFIDMQFISLLFKCSVTPTASIGAIFF
jgi:hypothetical protein